MQQVTEILKASKQAGARVNTAPRILVVDDDENVRILLQTALHKQGFDVLSASGGAEAIHMIDVERPDVVVLDLMMPLVDGFAVLRRIRYRVRRPRLVCLTAKAGSMARETAWRLGIDEFVTKPFEIAGLVDALSKVLGRTPVQRVARRLHELSECDPD